MSDSEPSASLRETTSGPSPQVPAEEFILQPDEGKSKRNARYYIEDTMSIFQVDDQLFKIHRHFLVKESDIFQMMFLCPPGPEGPDGSDDKRPIPLHGVTVSEFEALLDFFYTENFQHRSATLLQWIDLLSIATRYDFQRLRQCAIDAIDAGTRWHFDPGAFELNPIERIILAEKHDIPHWLPIAYQTLCERGSPLDAWEARRIGFEKTVLLARARELIRNSGHLVTVAIIEPPIVDHIFDSIPATRPASPNGFYRDHARVKAIVHEVFYPPAPEPVNNTKGAKKKKKAPF
ncbi:hypothetical protein C8F01DRAFT_1026476 [Mycena amicta]|nr:hypothetical protein C8F01DRAFT_1026476 [Mycena amicta]